MSEVALDLESIVDDINDIADAGAVAVPRGGDDAAPAKAGNLKIGGYFALWYTLNIVYNSEYDSITDSSI